MQSVLDLNLTCWGGGGLINIFAAILYISVGWTFLSFVCDYKLFFLLSFFVRRKEGF